MLHQNGSSPFIALRRNELDVWGLYIESILGKVGKLMDGERERKKKGEADRGGADRILT